MVRQSFFRGLAGDHRRLSDLVMSMRVERDPEELDELGAEFRDVIRRHAAVEDGELYPTLVEVVDGREDRVVLMGAHEYHRILMRLLDEMEETPSDREGYLGKIHVLDHLWTHHVEEEEEELYRMAQRYLDANDLMDLKRRIAAAEKRQNLQ